MGFGWSVDQFEKTPCLYMSSHCHFDPETEMFHDEELARFLLNKRVNKGNIKQLGRPRLW